MTVLREVRTLSGEINIIEHYRLFLLFRLFFLPGLIVIDTEERDRMALTGTIAGLEVIAHVFTRLE